MIAILVSNVIRLCTNYVPLLSSIDSLEQTLSVILLKLLLKCSKTGVMIEVSRSFLCSYSSEMLRKMSGHYQDTSKPLPDDIIDKILKARVKFMNFL